MHPVTISMPVQITTNNSVPIMITGTEFQAYKITANPLPSLLYYGLAWYDRFQVFQIRTWPTIEKRSFPFHIPGRHGRIGFMSLRYAPGPPWKKPPSPAILRVGTAHLVSRLPDKDLTCYRIRPITFHITGRYDRIGFRSSRYTPCPPWKTPPYPSILWIGRALALSPPRSRDVFLTFETVSLQFCFK